MVTTTAEDVKVKDQKQKRKNDTILTGQGTQIS